MSAEAQSLAAAAAAAATTIIVKRKPHLAPPRPEKKKGRKHTPDDRPCLFSHRSSSKATKPASHPTHTLVTRHYSTA